MCISSSSSSVCSFVLDAPPVTADVFGDGFARCPTTQAFEQRGGEVDEGIVWHACTGHHHTRGSVVGSCKLLERVCVEQRNVVCRAHQWAAQGTRVGTAVQRLGEEEDGSGGGGFELLLQMHPWVIHDK